MSKTIMVLAGLLLTVTACGGGTGQAREEGTVSRTIVHFRPDGSQDVTTVQISEAQQRAEIVAREHRRQNQPAGSSIGQSAQAISADSSCDGADLWLFDGTDLRGSEICFVGGGTAQLADYLRVSCFGETCFYGNWWHAVRSYWAGVSPGYLKGNAQLWGESGYEYFNAGDPAVNNAGYYAEQSFEVGLSF